MRFWLESMQIDVSVDGFVSKASAHRHLFKHLVPLYEHACRQDRERWHEVIPDPPLDSAYERRVKKLKSWMEKRANCLMVHNKRVQSCLECRDVSAQARVDAEVGELLSAWMAQARATVQWAFENRTPAGHPRAYVAAGQDGRLLLHTADPRKIRIVADVDLHSCRLRLLTCYRTGDSKKKNYEQIWLDLCREAAAARRLGTYRNIEAVQV